MVKGESKFGDSWLPDSLGQESEHVPDSLSQESEQVEVTTSRHQRFQFKRQFTTDESDDYDDDTSTLFDDIESQTRNTLFDDIESQTRSRSTRDYDDGDSSICDSSVYSDEASTTVCAPSRTSASLPQDSRLKYDEEEVKAMRTQIMNILEEREVSDERNFEEREESDESNIKGSNDDLKEREESDERNQSARIKSKEKKRTEGRDKTIERDRTRIKARPGSRTQLNQPTQLEIKQNTGNSRQKCIRTTLIILGVYCLVVSGLGGLLLKQLFQIPGLNREVRDLTEQVDRLESEIDRLSGEVDRLALENDKLETSNGQLETNISELQNENVITKGLVQDFNSTNLELKNLNQQLSEENEEYEEQTALFSGNITMLSEQLSSISSENDLMNSTLEQYQVIARALDVDLLEFGSTAEDLNMTVQALDEAIDRLIQQNEEFSELNEDLQTIAVFLEGSVQGVDQSYEDLGKELADTIVKKRALAETGLKDRMRAEMAGWECGLNTAFGYLPFGNDENIAIGNSHYGDVMDYIDQKILSDMCIDRINLDLYLKNEILTPGYNSWDINMKDLTFGVNAYVGEVFNYYFPDLGENGGIESAQWDAADYDCNNLSEDLVFQVV